MELLVRLDRLLLVDGAILGQTRQFAVVEDPRNDTLRNDSVSSVVDDRRGNVVQPVDLQNLKLAQTGQIVVCLAPAWILVGLSHVLEVVIRVNRVREEDQVVDEDLRSSLLGRVQRRDASLDDGDCSLSGGVQKVVVDLGDGSVPLSALGHIVLWEILDNLILLIPITYSFWV